MRHTTGKAGALALLATLPWAGVALAQDGPFGVGEGEGSNPFENPPAETRPPSANPFEAAEGSPFDAPPAENPFAAVSAGESPFDQPAAQPANPFQKPAAGQDAGIERPAWDIVRSPSEFEQRPRPNISSFYAARGPQRDASVLFPGERAQSPPIRSTLQAPGTVKWASSVEEALATSARDGRRVLVVFTSEKKASRDFERNVATDAEVAAAMSYYVPVRVDVRQDPALAERHAVPQTPYAVVLDSRGFTRAHVSGLQDKARLMRDLRRHSGL